MDFLDVGPPEETRARARGGAFGRSYDFSPRASVLQRRPVVATRRAQVHSARVGARETREVPDGDRALPRGALGLGSLSAKACPRARLGGRRAGRRSTSRASSRASSMGQPGTKTASRGLVIRRASEVSVGFGSSSTPNRAAPRRRVRTPKASATRRRQAAAARRHRRRRPWARPVGQQPHPARPRAATPSPRSPRRLAASTPRATPPRARADRLDRDSGRAPRRIKFSTRPFRPGSSARSFSASQTLGVSDRAALFGAAEEGLLPLQSQHRLRARAGSTGRCPGPVMGAPDDPAGMGAARDFAHDGSRAARSQHRVDKVRLMEEGSRARAAPRGGDPGRGAGRGQGRARARSLQRMAAFVARLRPRGQRPGGGGAPRAHEARFQIRQPVEVGPLRDDRRDHGLHDSRWTGSSTS